MKRVKSNSDDAKTTKDVISLTHDEYRHMKRGSRTHIRKLLGAITDKESSDTYIKTVTQPHLDAEKKSFSTRRSIMFRDASDPLYQIYLHIRSTVPIVWDPTLGQSDAKRAARSSRCIIYNFTVIFMAIFWSLMLFKYGS